MVFHAYVNNINDDWSSRYIVAFASYSVADEWWRAVSTSRNTKYSDSVKRINPQFYLHDTRQANAANSLTDPTVAPNFLGTVFFTLLPDKDHRAMSVIPPQRCTDHVSGNVFFIRSKASAEEYWYCPNGHSGNVAPNTKVYVSRTERTRFRVRLIKGSTDCKGTIMIGSDNIAITLVSISLSIKVSDNGQLIVSKSPESCMKFSDLVNGFTAGGFRNENCGAMREIFRTLDDGEEWELV